MLPSSLAGTNLEQAKGFNRRVVVEALRRNAPCSRAELARLTHLAPQTISNIIGEFLADDLVRVAGRRRGRGQPQVDLILNADAAISIGLSLEHDRLEAIAMNLDGAVRASWSTLHDDPRPANLLPRIVAGVETLRARLTSAPWGVGLAMPGPFSVDAAVFAGPTTLPGWEGQPVAQQVSQALGLPVMVERDAVAAGRAEYLYGSARDLRSFFVLHFGRGLGGSAFNDGQPLRGARGNAGEIGLMIVEPGGRPHPGGPDGCLEAYASLHALQDRIAEAGLSVADPNHPIVIAWVEEAARHLRFAVSVIETLFDPEAIIISGGLEGRLVEQLMTALEPLHPSIASQPRRPLPRLLSGSVGQTSPALGAAALPFYDWLSPNSQGLRKPADAGNNTLSFGLRPEAQNTPS